MPLSPLDAIIPNLSNLNTSSAAKPGHDAIAQKPASRGFVKCCSDLFHRGRASKQPVALTQFRHYHVSSMAFNATLQHGKVVVQGSQAGREMADRLNQLPKRFMQDSAGVDKGQGLRFVDQKLNVFHLSCTPAAAAVFKSSRTQAASPEVINNPGRAHLGQVSGVHTTQEGDQFRLIEQRLHRFEPQTDTWLPDKDQGQYQRLGLTNEGALMKVPQGITDMSVEGTTQVSLMQSEDDMSLEIANTATGGAPARLTPVSESGEPVALTRIGLAGHTLFATTEDGELLRADLRSADKSLLQMHQVPVELPKSGAHVKGFMHDDNGQLNALVADNYKQLHSNPLTDNPRLLPEWNLTDVMLKVVDRGVPDLDLKALAGSIDLGQRGKVALEGGTLMSWDSAAQSWDKTPHVDVDHLARGLDGRAYALQAGQLKELTTLKSQEPVHMGGSYDLAPPARAQTHVTLAEVMAGDEARIITGFAVENGKRFVSLDDKNQLHAHIDGKEKTLTFTTPTPLKALALDHLGNLYGQTQTDGLVRLDKADWQSPDVSDVAWRRVQLPDNQPLKSLRMGADQHLIASWGENNPQEKRWGEKNRRLDISAQGALQWGPVTSSSNKDASPISSVLMQGQMKGHINGTTAWSASSTVLGQTQEGVTESSAYFKGFGTHFKPVESFKEVGRDIQHYFKGRVGLQGLYANDKALRTELKNLANAQPATTDMTTRLEQLSLKTSTQPLADELKSALVLVEGKSAPLATRLGEMHGATVTPEPNGVTGKRPPSSDSSLNQMRQAFERLSPSQTNVTAALLRSYEGQGVALSKWSADVTRDVKNPTALVEGGLIHHALTLSRLSHLVTALEGEAPDLVKLGGELKGIMQDYHDSPVHKKSSQNINNFAQAEALYKNFKLLSKDLGTPGGALSFHISRLLGVAEGKGLKEALLQDILQSSSGQSLTSSRDKKKSVGLIAFDIQPVPIIEFFVGASREKSNSVSISRTDTGANVKIGMNTAHSLSGSIGTGVTPLSTGGGGVVGNVRLGTELELTVAHGRGSAIDFDVKEADLPNMLDSLFGGDLDGLLSLGADHKSGKTAKTGADLTVNVYAQARANVIGQERSGTLSGVMRAAIGGAASLNLAHWGNSHSVTQGDLDISESHGSDTQLLSRGGVSAGNFLGATLGMAQVEPNGAKLASYASPTVSFAVSFDRSVANSFNFTFTRPDAVKPEALAQVCDAFAQAFPEYRSALQALPLTATQDIGEQLQTVQRLFDTALAPVHKREQQHALKDQLDGLQRQHQQHAQNGRALSSVARTVSYVGLNGDSRHSWLNDASPANKAAIIRLLENQPELARTVKSLESSEGTSVSIGLELKPSVLRALESTLMKGQDGDGEIERALQNVDNVRVKSFGVSYSASRSDRRVFPLPLPLLSISSAAGISHAHKLLSAEFEYGQDQNTPLRMKFKDAMAAPERTDSNPALREQKIRDQLRTEV